MSPLVLIHGFTGSPAGFDEVVQHIGPPGAGRVYRPALLGHGLCPVSRARSFEQEVDRVARELRAAGVRAAHLCGYSMGARVALGLLARHAYLFAGATLIGVHPGLTADAERAARVGQDERWCRLLLDQGMPAFVRAWEAQAMFASRSRQPQARVREQSRRRLAHDAGGLAAALRVLGLGQMPCYRGVLLHSLLRVRLLVGGMDQKFVQIARALVSVRRQLSLEIVEGAGHDLPFEAPRRVADVLLRAAELDHRRETARYEPGVST